MKELSRRVTAEEYEEACRIMQKYGFENGWVQELRQLTPIANCKLKLNCIL